MDKNIMLTAWMESLQANGNRLNVKRYKVQMELEGSLSLFTRPDSFTLLTRKTKLEPV